MRGKQGEQPPHFKIVDERRRTAICSQSALQRGGLSLPQSPFSLLRSRQTLLRSPRLDSERGELYRDRDKLSSETANRYRIRGELYRDCPVRDSDSRLLCRDAHDRGSERRQLWSGHPLRDRESGEFCSEIRVLEPGGAIGNSCEPLIERESQTKPADMLGSARASRAGADASSARTFLGEALPRQKHLASWCQVDCDEGATISTRGACAPQ